MVSMTHVTALSLIWRDMTHRCGTVSRLLTVPSQPIQLLITVIFADGVVHPFKLIYHWRDATSLIPLTKALSFISGTDWLEGSIIINIQKWSSHPSVPFCQLPFIAIGVTINGYTDNIRIIQGLFGLNRMHLSYLLGCSREYLSVELIWPLHNAFL